MIHISFTPGIWHGWYDWCELQASNGLRPAWVRLTYTQGAATQFEMWLEESLFLLVLIERETLLTIFFKLGCSSLWTYTYALPFLKILLNRKPWLVSILERKSYSWIYLIRISQRGMPLIVINYCILYAKHCIYVGKVKYENKMDST